MKIGFIGAGKAGTSLGVYFKNNGIPVSGYFSKSIDSTKQAADLTESTAFSNLEEIVNESDMIFITTPDGIIGQIAEKLSKENFDLVGKYICHLSGSVSSEVLQCASTKCASVHPMIAMSGRKTDLSQTFFTMEGQDETIGLLNEIFQKCGNKTTKIDTEKKSIYHCAASVASNLMVGLAQISINMLTDCGFKEEEALKLLSPLMKNNISSVCSKGPMNALTGPVERADDETVEKHLKSFEGLQIHNSSTMKADDIREIYRLLSLELVEIAREKNKSKNYNKTRELLEEK